MKNEVMSLEVAEKEWREFLEDNDATALIPDESLKGSKIEEERKEYINNKNGFDKVVRAISRGLVVINDGVITQNLRYPVVSKDDSRVMLDKLIFGQRWTAKDREETFKGLNTKDDGEMFVAQRRFASKLTGVDMIILQKIDGLDYKITDQIVSVFFM